MGGQPTGKGDKRRSQAEASSGNADANGSGRVPAGGTSGNPPAEAVGGGRAAATERKRRLTEVLDAFESVGKALVALTEPSRVVRSIAAVKGCEEIAGKLHTQILGAVPLLREAQAKLSDALDTYYKEA